MACAVMALRRVGVFDVFARAGAGVGMALRNELVQCLLVKGAACGLPHRRCVGQQAAGGQLLQDDIGRARNAARCVHVFDAHQPAPAAPAVA